MHLDTPPAHTTLQGVAENNLFPIMWVQLVKQHVVFSDDVDTAPSEPVLFVCGAEAKTKKVLSANREAPFNVECLMEDQDVLATVVPQFGLPS